MITGSVHVLIAVLVILSVAFAAFWLVDKIGLPAPMNWVARAIVALIALLVLLSRAGWI
jgi:hypothetical protein